MNSLGALFLKNLHFFKAGLPLNSLNILPPDVDGDIYSFKIVCV